MQHKAIKKCGVFKGFWFGGLLLIRKNAKLLNIAGLFCRMIVVLL